MNEIETKTAELAGLALHWAVAKATRDEMPSAAQFKVWDDYRPSSNWTHLGRQIDRLQISLHAPQHDKDCWAAWIRTETAEVVQGGPTAQVAACRAIVASVFGDVVPIPDVLLIGQEQSTHGR